MTDADARYLSALVCRPLFDAWGGTGKNVGRPIPLDGELTRLGLFAADAGVVAACALTPVSLAAQMHEYPTAAGLGRQCIELLDEKRHSPPFRLLRRTALACGIVGDTGRASDLLRRTVDMTRGQESVEAAQALAEYGEFLVGRGEIDQAEKHLRDAVAQFGKLKEEKQRAVALGRIADILQARGQLDEALRIRREEELPVYERLGDVRSKAVTMGKVADILQARGQLVDALRIRREEELPVYERLGDVRSKAVTMAKIADILQARGQLDEALREFETVAVVFTNLGDVHSFAVVRGRVADIYFARGQLDEALRIRREEQLPVYERLGDVRSLVVLRAQIGMSLIQRGNAEDLEPAVKDLMWAHAAAKKIGLREAAQIEAILSQLFQNSDPESDEPPA